MTGAAVVRGWISAVAAFTLYLTLACADSVECLPRDDAGKSPPELLETLSESPDGYLIHLADVLPFAWDTMFAFGPYATTDEIRKTTGLSLRGGILGEGVPEGTALYVFTANGRPVCSFFVRPSETRWGFVGRSNWQSGLSRESAVFRVRHRDGETAFEYVDRS